MRRTVYALDSLRETRTGVTTKLNVNLPMNTPLMLVRTAADGLTFKRLKGRSHINKKRTNPVDQVSLF